MKTLLTLGTLAGIGTSPLNKINLINTQQSNNKNLIDLNKNTSWLIKFQSSAPTFALNGDNFFDVDEEILDNKKYAIVYQGSLVNEDVFSIKVKEINKFYEIRVPWSSMIRDLSTKNQLKKELGYKLVSKFESEMVSYIDKIHGITARTIEGNSKMTLNANSVNFRSSWGVSNSDSEDFNGTIQIDRKDLINSINIQNKLPSNQVIDSISTNEVQVLPLIEVNDPPIDSARFELSNFILNNINNSLSSFNPELPSGHGKGSEWWHGLTSSLGLIGGVLLTATTGGLGAPTLGFGIISGGLYSHSTDDGRHSGITADQQKFFKRLAKHKMIYSKNVDISNGINVKFSGNFKGSAAATAIFGNNSRMSIADLVFGLLIFWPFFHVVARLDIILDITSLLTVTKSTLNLFCKNM